MDKVQAHHDISCPGSARSFYVNYLQCSTEAGNLHVHDLMLFASITGKPSKVMLVTFLVVAYSLCSSMLLILNKVSHAAPTSPAALPAFCLLDYGCTTSNSCPTFTDTKHMHKT